MSACGPIGRNGAFSLLPVLALLLMASCRCVPSKGLLGALRRASWFTRLFSRHCILWGIFAAVLVVHVVFAAGFLGIPW